MRVTETASSNRVLFISQTYLDESNTGLFSYKDQQIC